MRKGLIFVIAGIISSQVVIAAGEQMVIPTAVQASRDNTRKVILSEEYNTEYRELQRKQAQLGKALPEQAAEIKAQIRNHQANMQAIQAELSRVGRTKLSAPTPKLMVTAVTTPKPERQAEPQPKHEDHRVVDDPGVPNEYDAFGGV